MWGGAYGTEVQGFQLTESRNCEHVAIFGCQCSAVRCLERLVKWIVSNAKDAQAWKGVLKLLYEAP